MCPFLITRSRSLSPFFSLSFAGLPPTFSFSLSFSCSIFQMAINLSLILSTTRIQTQFPLLFSSLLTLELSLLYKMQVAMRFPAKVTSNCIWVAILVDWVFLHWFACGADGRLGGRAYGHVLTKFYWMARLLHFLTHGAPLSSLRVRELRYKSNDHNVNLPYCNCH